MSYIGRLKTAFFKATHRKHIIYGLYYMYACTLVTYTHQCWSHFGLIFFAEQNNTKLMYCFGIKALTFLKICGFKKSR